MCFAELLFNKPIPTEIDLLYRNVIVRGKEEFEPGEYTNTNVKWKFGVAFSRKGN